jgi:hypothetical protein
MARAPVILAPLHIAVARASSTTLAYLPKKIVSKVGPKKSANIW